MIMKEENKNTTPNLEEKISEYEKQIDKNESIKSDIKPEGFEYFERILEENNRLKKENEELKKENKELLQKNNGFVNNEEDGYDKIVRKAMLKQEEKSEDKHLLNNDLSIEQQILSRREVTF